MSFTSLAKNCTENNIPGTKMTLYLQAQSAFTAVPTPIAAPAVAGDKNRLEGTYTFALEPAPQGFATIPIIADTGDIMHKVAGELAGTKAVMSEVAFQIAGNGAEQLEFLGDLVRLDGCAIAVLEDRNGNRFQFGDLEFPAQLVSFEGGTGKKTGDANQGTYLLKFDNGKGAGILADSVAAIPTI